MNQKEAKVIRESLYEAVKEIEFEGFTHYGNIQEGAVFEKEGNFVLIKAIVKKEAFADEVEELINDFVAKQTEKK